VPSSTTINSRSGCRRDSAYAAEKAFRKLARSPLSASGVPIAFGGKPCSPKRHFGPGCIRQIIGFAEKLADNDPDRFIWIKNWSKTAKRGRNGESGVYSVTQIKRSVWGLEACQFLVPAQKLRNGQIRTGWIVARHDDVATIDGRKCRLQAAPQFTISPRVWGQRLAKFIGAEIDVRGTVQGTVESTLGDCLGDCLGGTVGWRQTVGW
jgi:hypothetical protein